MLTKDLFAFSVTLLFATTKMESVQSMALNVEPRQRPRSASSSSQSKESSSLAPQPQHVNPAPQTQDDEILQEHRHSPFPHVSDPPHVHLDVDPTKTSHINVLVTDIPAAPTKPSTESNENDDSTMLRKTTSASAMAQRLAQRLAPLSKRGFSTTQQKHQAALSALTRQHWNSYVATGRGSAALFDSIDADADGKICPADARVFVESVEHTMSEKALKQLEQRVADDEPLDLHAFQRWLIDATHPEGYKSVQDHYKDHPHVGDTKSAEQTKPQFAWNASTMSQSLRRMQYAVRGEVVIKADKLAAQGRQIIYTNIGNPHQVQQQPITFYRQVLALCDLPSANGVDHPDADKLFPADVLERARELRSIVGPAGTGAYTNSQGLLGVREHVADYIEQRDGHDAYTGNIFLTNGASAGIEMVLNALISSDMDGIMIPIPQVRVLCVCVSCVLCVLQNKTQYYYYCFTDFWFGFGLFLVWFAQQCSLFGSFF